MSDVSDLRSERLTINYLPPFADCLTLWMSSSLTRRGRQETRNARQLRSGWRQTNRGRSLPRPPENRTPQTSRPTFHRHNWEQGHRLKEDA